MIVPVNALLDARMATVARGCRDMLRLELFAPKSVGTSVQAFALWRHAVAFREMRIAQILTFVPKAKRVLSSNGVLHTLINRKCG